MNWYLTFAVFFTFVFIINAIQSINYYTMKASGKVVGGSYTNYSPFICAILSSIFWGLSF